ncbi:MAG: HPP family protein [Gammaproteobacteria bacterium]|nr:HPP family protein [Gammaproteobacteria bacterium]
MMSHPVIKPNTMPQNVSVREKFTSSIIAFVALVLVGLVSMKTIGLEGFPFMVASMGASSVLLFAVPYSPLSQPWPFIGGHLVSTTVGVSCALFIADPVLAAAAAVSLAIAAMHFARCLHPPGGAVALAAVLGGEQIHSLGYLFILYPVFVNTMLLMGVALLLNNMVPGRRYPSARRNVKEAGASESWEEETHAMSRQDFRSAIQSLDEFVDITDVQLDKIYRATVLQMRKRQLGNIRCEQVMSSDVVSVKDTTSVAQAWRELQRKQVTAVPVLDHKNRVIGIVTQTDLANRILTDIDTDAKNGTRVTTGQLSRKPIQQTVVGELMSAPVITIHADRHILDALSLFVDRHIHQLPVVDTKRVIQGMLSKTDLLALLQQKAA